MAKKKLTEAQYTLSVEGLESADADTLSQILSLAGQVDNGAGALGGDMGISPVDSLDMGMPDVGDDFISPSASDDMGMGMDALDAEPEMGNVDPMGDEGMPGELGADPVEEPMDVDVAPDEEFMEDDMFMEDDTEECSDCAGYKDGDSEDDVCGGCAGTVKRLDEKEMTDKQKEFFGKKDDKDEDDSDDDKEEVDESIDRIMELSGFEESEEYVDEEEEDLGEMSQMRETMGMMEYGGTEHMEDVDRAAERMADLVDQGMDPDEAIVKAIDENDYLHSAFDKEAVIDAYQDYMMEDVDFANRSEPQEVDTGSFEGSLGASAKISAGDKKAGDNPMEAEEIDESYSKMMNEFEEFKAEKSA